MATALVGEAAIRIVPSLRGFKPEADRRLKEMRFEPIRVKIDPGFTEADAQMDAWRARQRLNAVNVPIKADIGQFRRDITQVEYIFKKSSLSKAIRLNIKVIGLDALPALAYAAGSAASGLDSLAKSALILPGLLGGVGASVGALLIGLRGVSETLKAYATDSKNVAQDAIKQQDANRALARSYQDYKGAVRDTIREIQDLNTENRRSSLNVADALLSVQEARERLAKGGFSSVTEYQRAQLGLAESIEHVQDVMTKAQRTTEDTTEANRKGVAGADKVVDALQAIQANTAKLDESKISEVDKAMEKLSPNAKAAVDAIHSFSAAWTHLEHSVQDNLFSGIDQSIKDLGQRTLPGLEVGLSRVASGLNKNFKSVAESLGNEKNGSFLQRIFGNTDHGLDNLSKGMNPLIEGFSRLTAVSSNFLPRLGDAADKVFTRFDAWTEKISADNSLNHWIDQGLKAIDSLGRATVSIAGIVSSVSKAFDEASGHQGGFIKTLDDETKKLDDFLKTGHGRGELVNYFKQAKEFITNVKDALKAMKPFLKDVVETTRDWSVGMFSVVGLLTQTATWIDRNTGLLKLLVAGYLTVRTAKPIIEGLSGAWKIYANTVKSAASQNSPFRNLSGVQATANNLARFRGEFVATNKEIEKAHALARDEADALASRNRPKLGLTASERAEFARFNAMSNNPASFASPKPLSPEIVKKLKDYEAALLAVSTASGKATKAHPLLQQAAAGLHPQLTVAGNAANYASSKYSAMGTSALEAAGKVGEGKVSLLGRIGALGKAIGPGAAMMVAIPLAEVALHALGDAHRKAAEDADRQREALDALAGSLDTVTGAAGKAALTEASKGAKKYSIPGLGERDLFADAQRSGLATSDQQFASVLNPANGAERGDFVRRGDAKNLALVEGSDEWKRNGHLWQSKGVTPFLLARAAGGEPDALKIVQFAYNQMLEDNNISAKEPDWMKQPEEAAARGAGRLPADLTGLITGLGTPSSITATIGVRDISKKLEESGQVNAQVNRAVNGHGKFKSPDVAAYWAQFGGMNDDSHIALGPDGLAIISTSSNPGLDEAIGHSEEQSPGHWQTSLTKDATDQYIQKFADGGMVRGVGGPRDDNHLVAVSPGEHITNADAVRYYGVGLFDALNSKSMPAGFAPGGWPLDPAFPEPGPTVVPTPPPGVKAPPYMDLLAGSGLGPMPVAPAPAPPPPPIAPVDTMPGPVGAPVPPLPPRVLLPPPALTAPGAAGAPTDGKVTIPGVTATTGPPAEAIAAIAANPAIPPASRAGVLDVYERQFSSYMGARAGMSPQDRATADQSWISKGYNPSAPYVDYWQRQAGGSPPAAGAPPALTPGSVPHTTRVPSSGAPQVPIGRTPAYALTPGPNGPVIAPNGPVMANLNSMLQGLVGTPYTGSFSPAGLDCSGLASLVSNTVSGRDPWGGGRFTTHNELQELTARGFTPGKGPPGTVTIGWNDAHTAITLPDGTNVSSGETGGFAYGGGGANQSQFTNWMYMPVDSGALSALSGSLPGGNGLGGAGIAGLGLTGPGGRAPGLAGLPDNLKPGKVLGAAGSILLQGLAGAFGIDTSYLGDIDQVANFGLSKLFGGKGQDPNLTGLTDEALQDGVNGQPGLSDSLKGGLGALGFTGAGGSVGGNGPLALDGNGAPTGADGADGVGGAGGTGGAKGKIGGEAYRSMIRATLQAYGPKFGIPAKAYPQWENSLVSQIDTESTGDVGAKSTAGDVGLLQFKPGTFEQFNVIPGANIKDPQAQVAAALNRLTQKTPGNNGYTMNADGTPKQIGKGAGWASGGFPDGLAYLSAGEYRTSPAATAKYGPALFNALNAKAIPRSTAQKFAKGGWPGVRKLWDGDFIPPIPAMPAPAAPGGQSNGPMGLGQAAPPPAAAGAPPGPDMAPNDPPPMPGGMPGAPGFAPAPGTGGPPGPGATAPAPDPGTLPGVTDALAQIGGAGGGIGGGGGGMPQPGADDGNGADPRATLGAAPVSNDHNLPALSKGIQGAAEAAGNAGAMAAAIGSMGMGGGAAGSMISAGAQMGGQVATGAVNILSSLLVGTATGGSTGSASGVPMLPQRQPMQAGGVQPIQQRIHNGDVNVSNLDEYTRRQQTIEAQQAMPFISKYG